METTQISDASCSWLRRTKERTSPRNRFVGALAAGGLIGATLFVGSTPAQAVNTGVSVEGTVLRVAASPGKSNSITVYPSTHDGKAYYTITDTGDSMIAGNKCVKVTSFNIRCQSAGVQSVWIETGDRNDTVSMDSMSLPTGVVAGSGSDLVFGGSNKDVVYGQQGNDTLHGQAGNDVVDGGAGEDRLTGGSGNDYLDGGADNDHLQGNSGNDSIFGRMGNDVMYGQGGNDTMHGNEGDDILDGGSGDDALYGNAGKDALSDRLGGKDRLFGGTDNDVLDGVDDVPFNDYLNGEQGRDDCRADGGDNVVNCEVKKITKIKAS